MLSVQTFWVLKIKLVGVFNIQKQKSENILEMHFLIRWTNYSLIGSHAASLSPILFPFSFSIIEDLRKLPRSSNVTVYVPLFNVPAGFLYPRHCSVLKQMGYYAENKIGELEHDL